MDETTPLVAALDRLTAAQNRIADEIGRQADATLLLARATAGEFDEAEDAPDPNDPPLPPGYKGMR